VKPRWSRPERNRRMNTPPKKEEIEMNKEPKSIFALRK